MCEASGGSTRRAFNNWKGPVGSRQETRSYIYGQVLLIILATDSLIIVNQKQKNLNVVKTHINIPKRCQNLGMAIVTTLLVGLFNRLATGNSCLGIKGYIQVFIWDVLNGDGFDDILPNGDLPKVCAGPAIVRDNNQLGPDNRTV